MANEDRIVWGVGAILMGIALWLVVEAVLALLRGPSEPAASQA